MTDDVTDDTPLSAAAEYALGLLTPSEARAFETQMQRDIDLRAELVLWQEHLVTLTDDIAPVAPPSRTYNAIAAILFATPKKRWSLAGLLAGAVSATALMVAVSIVVLPTPNSPDNDLVAGLVSAATGLRVDAVFDPDTNVLRVARVAGGPAQGRALEMWLIAGTDAPVSLGLVPDALTGRVRVPENLASLITGGIIAISDEPLGGSPTGAPTGDVLAISQFSSV